MAGIRAAVYDPPGPGMPYVAVIIGTDGRVLMAEAVPSRERGERILADILNDFAQKAREERGKQ